MIGTLATLLFDEARRIWCYRWLALFVAVALFAAAAAYVVRLPDIYDAWGQVFVSKQTPLTTAAEGVSLVGDSYGSPYFVQKTLLNDQSLEAVVKLRAPGAAQLSRPAMASLVSQLRSQIHVTDQGDGFLEFHYVDIDPARAQRTVQLLLEQFISRNVDRSRTDLARAERFLDEQIAAYGNMLSASQARIVEFRRQHPEVTILPLPPGAETIETQAGGFAPPPVPAGAAPVAAPARPSAAAERVAGLEAKLASLRTVFTEQYPDVVAIKRQLSEAMAERDEEERLAAAAAAAAPQTAAAPSGAPAAPAPARLAPVLRRMAAPRLPPPLPPEVASQWVDLQRKDEVLRVGYQQLIGRREATRMSQAIYGDNGSGKYQITRPPTTPTLPVAPKRSLYLVAAALLSLGGGLGAAYVRAGMKGIMVAPRELEQAFQLPVVGTVSWERAWHTRRTSGRSRSKPLALPITPADA